MIQNLNTAHWQHSKKKAELISDSETLIEMEFSRKATLVKIVKQKFEITKDGFWCPKILITEKDKIVTLQKQLGLWGTKSEFVLDEQTYTAKTKQGILFNITYSNSTGDILTYKLDTLKSKPKITFEIKSYDISEKHLLLLLALGFYSIKNVAVEAMANDFIVTAVA
jgi:hypothetical protein